MSKILMTDEKIDYTKTVEINKASIKVIPVKALLCELS